MSKVISVLEKMASDAAMNGESAIADLVATSDINNGQQQAILANAPQELIKTINNLQEVQSVFLIPAEDEEPLKEGDEEENTDTTSHLTIAVNA